MSVSTLDGGEDGDVDEGDVADNAVVVAKFAWGGRLAAPPLVAVAELVELWRGVTSALTVAAMRAFATSLAVTPPPPGAALVMCSSPVPAAPGTYPDGNDDDDVAVAAAAAAADSI